MKINGDNCVYIAAAVFKYVKMGRWKWHLIAVTSQTIGKQSTDWPNPTTGSMQPSSQSKQLVSHCGGQILPASTKQNDSPAQRTEH